MTEKTYQVPLTAKELLTLNGNVSEEAQKVIDLAIQEARIGFDLPLINEIIHKAEQTGKLTWRYKTMRSCSYCDKSYAYVPHTRNSRYHRKGQPNHNKPIMYSGLSFNEGFISISGVADICSDCAAKYNVIHKAVDYILEHDLRIEIQKNDYKPTRYVKDIIRECYKCHQEMQESQMGKLEAIMGGHYPGKCPNCGAEQTLFGLSHKITDKFVMQRV